MDSLQQSLIGQIDRASQLYTSYESQQNTLLGQQVLGEFIAAASAAIERATGPDSTYAREAARHITTLNRESGTLMAPMSRQVIDNSIRQVNGVLQALRHDVAAGYVQSVRETIHGEVFADFIEEAGILLQDHHKDAAAVIAGGVLETHLRALCAKHGIDTQTEKDGEFRAKRAGQLNDELYKQSAYPSLDHKGVTQWLDLRNKAAHAERDAYDEKQVSFMIQEITAFIQRHPA